jgi:hypothetical protein
MSDVSLHNELPFVITYSYSTVHRSEHDPRFTENYSRLVLPYTRYARRYIYLSYCLSHYPPLCAIPMHSARRRQILGSLHRLSGSRDSAGDIATGYGLDDRGIGVRVPVGSRIFFSLRRPDQLWGTTRPIQCIRWVLCLGGKAAGA